MSMQAVRCLVTLFQPPANTHLSLACAREHDAPPRDVQRREAARLLVPQLQARHLLQAAAGAGAAAAASRRPAQQQHCVFDPQADGNQQVTAVAVTGARRGQQRERRRLL